MLGKDEEKQSQFMFVNLHDFLPQDHLLQTIKRTVDFSFLYEKVKDLLANRPSLRRSCFFNQNAADRVLVRNCLRAQAGARSAVQPSLPVVLRVRFSRAVLDHSMISQNRRRRFKNSPLFQEIFDTIVSRCVEEGLVTDEVIVTVSPHIKASASRQRVEKIWVEKTLTEICKLLSKKPSALS